jgi:hypothetical protein
MHCVDSLSEISEAISLTKADAREYCSNFFPAPQKLQAWVRHGELFRKQMDGAALFLRKDRDFWHLYFCAANPSLLSLALTDFAMLHNDPVVSDLVGFEANLCDLTGLFEASGFRVYNRLFRMARTVPITTAQTVPIAPESRVTDALLEDSQPILELLLRSFDYRAEQIPMLYEIQTAVETGQIQVVRVGGLLAGLLFSETQGLTSTLRYWLTAPEFQTQGYGSQLMRKYFAENPAVRRFLLWVIADNASAIAKYEHYGFASDNLVDKVMANEMIRP